MKVSAMFDRNITLLQTRAVLVFATERKNNVDPQPAISEEGELRSAVFLHLYTAYGKVGQLKVNNNQAMCHLSMKLSDTSDQNPLYF